MGYALLTGGTGLLGSYLVRDAMLAGRRVAVVARAGRSQSARQRVERILHEFEVGLGRPVPRPVVLEGNLTSPVLGLDNDAIGWIARHCTSVIHCAASLTFQGGDRRRDPWLSNVEGTARVMELCRRTGVRQFHYVSTAYVCGLRDGLVREDELDLGQQFGNDYEQSKVEAEKMLRGADFLDPLTVYRPSIIVGDSRSGWTTTYHGFYALVRLAHTLVSRLSRGSTAGWRVVDGFGLSGSERKNFVPVDWVSAVMTRLVGQPDHWGKTYHLTSPQPVPLATVADVIQRAVETYSTLASEADPLRCDAEWFNRNFIDEMKVYLAYWRDDPQFDDGNTKAAVPHLPCPEIDEAMLLGMARFAIESNFGKAKRRPVTLTVDGPQPASGPHFAHASGLPVAPAENNLEFLSHALSPEAT